MTLLAPYQFPHQPLCSEPPPPYTPSQTPSYTPQPPHPSMHQHTLPTSISPYLFCEQTPPHLSRSSISRYGRYLTTLSHSVNSTTYLYRLCPRFPANSQPRIYAVKIIPSSSQPPPSTQLFKNNVLNSNTINHPNILLPFLPAIIDDAGNHHLITPYCTGGTLHELIASTTQLAPAEANCFFKQLLRGVAYLHNHPNLQSHLDQTHIGPPWTSLTLNPQDILLTGAGTVRIKVRAFSPSSPHAARSSPYYAPELYRVPNNNTNINENTPKALDAWALGMIYLFMRTGRPAWSVAQAEEDRMYARYARERAQEGGFALIEDLGPVSVTFIPFPHWPLSLSITKMAVFTPHRIVY
ncbi:kinase-like protein [Aspergillus brunneoviolaceus CBS 621.78]|uniref:Kinase-like protein n=1 Tax=Aspergillus brunneoviolaceus CBS 621.78 TaxID=1450534 RepID=A0ACD1GD95_9EURO|nr:kinase-like protein [Aspergillus brunneoviolaceus CBS 621.78]RAH47226.1 kinase-like protein [Aspergillus brunneoviolaceus CBS 621.78]